MKLLIVDDERHVVQGLRNMIDWTELGFNQVLTALDGLRAWEVFQEEDPDFLITDIFMPNWNGLELIKAIRSAGKTIPIVILSGYDEFEYAKEALHLNVSQYILKPAVYTEILEVMKECLRELEAERKKNQYWSEFQKRLDENLPVLRKQFLFDMITFGLREAEANDHRLRFYGLDSTVLEGGLVLSLKIHRSDDGKTQSERDWQLLKYAVSNIAQEIVESHDGGYVLRYMEDRLPLLLFGRNKDETEEKANVIAEQLIANIGKYLDLDSNVGIGRWYNQMEKYPLSEKESREILMLSEYEGHQRVFKVDDDRGQGSAERWIDYPGRQVRKMFPAFLRMDKAQVDEQWGRVKQMLLQTDDVPLPSLQAICFGIVNSLYLYLIDHHPDLGESMDLFLSMQQLRPTSDREETIDWLEHKLYAILDHLERPEGKGDRKGYVDHVKKIVYERYHENISFAEIARELHLSRNYLSHLFKRETGESFMNFLTGYRMQKAKDLMDTNRYMIYEICEKVGYSDPAYFSRMFKNATGLNPSEYMMGSRPKR